MPKDCYYYFLQGVLKHFCWRICSRSRWKWVIISINFQCLLLYYEAGRLNMTFQSLFCGLFWCGLGSGNEINYVDSRVEAEVILMLFRSFSTIQPDQGDMGFKTINNNVLIHDVFNYVFKTCYMWKTFTLFLKIIFLPWKCLSMYFYDKFSTKGIVLNIFS